MSISENLYNSNLELKKIIHHNKTYEIPLNDIINDVKAVIIEKYNTIDLSDASEDNINSLIESIIIKQEQIRDTIVNESFKPGKAYKHANGEKLLIHDYVDTYYYGKCLLAETDKADYKVVGDKEENSSNFKEIPMCDFIKCEKDIDIDRVFIPDDEDDSFTSTEECLDYELYLLDKTYYDIENIIYESYKCLYQDEENYIQSLVDNIVLEADNENRIKKTGVVKGAAKAGASVVKGATKMWETLLNFLRKIKEMFLSKHKKITERDATWLKDNRDKLLNTDTNGVEINIHSDYARSYEQSKTHFINFKTEINNKYNNFKDYDSFKKSISKFCDQNGDLKQGLMNLYRTGKTNSEYTIQTITGSNVKKVILPLMNFCESFINAYNDINKELKESEDFIKRLKRESDARNVTVKEGYCHIEESYYSDMDLALFYDFDAILEADENNTDNKTETSVNQKTDDQKSNQENKKVEVKQRDDIKDTTDKMSDNQLSVYNKICRDKNTGITTFMSAMEKKYFESIKILRGLLHEGNTTKKEEKK